METPNAMPVAKRSVPRACALLATNSAPNTAPAPIAIVIQL